MSIVCVYGEYLKIRKYEPSKKKFVSSYLICWGETDIKNVKKFQRVRYSEIKGASNIDLILNNKEPSIRFKVINSLEMSRSSLETILSNKLKILSFKGEVLYHFSGVEVLSPNDKVIPCLKTTILNSIYCSHVYKYWKLCSGSIYSYYKLSES